MSSGTNHQLGYVVCYPLFLALILLGGVWFRLDTTTIVFSFIIGLVASVFPDIDAPTSTIRVQLQTSLLIGAIVIFFAYEHYKLPALFLTGVCVLLVVFLMTISRHRRFCHSLTFLLIMSGAVYLTTRFLVNQIVAVDPIVLAGAWGFGNAVHLIMDKLGVGK